MVWCNPDLIFWGLKPFSCGQMGNLPRYMICVYLASAKWMSTPPYSTKLWQFYAFLITWGLFLVVAPELKFTSCDQFHRQSFCCHDLKDLIHPSWSCLPASEVTLGLNAKTQGGGLVAGWVGVGAWVGGSGGGYLSCLMTSYVQTIANSNDPSTSIRKKNVQKMQPFFISLIYIIYYIWVYFEGDGPVIL